MQSSALPAASDDPAALDEVPVFDELPVPDDPPGLEDPVVLDETPALGVPVMLDDFAVLDELLFPEEDPQPFQRLAPPISPKAEPTGEGSAQAKRPGGIVIPPSRVPPPSDCLAPPLRSGSRDRDSLISRIRARILRADRMEWA